nr:hypothetical protein CFP56_09422 [Quercus suber]
MLTTGMLRRCIFRILCLVLPKFSHIVHIIFYRICLKKVQIKGCWVCNETSLKSDANTDKESTRLIDSNFGFSFAFDGLVAVNQPVSPLGTVPEERTAKRQKRSIVDNDQCITSDAGQLAEPQTGYLSSVPSGHLEQSPTLPQKLAQKDRKKIQFEIDATNPFTYEAGSPLAKPKRRGNAIKTREQRVKADVVLDAPQDDQILKVTKKPRSKKSATEAENVEKCPVNCGNSLAFMQPKKSRKQKKKGEDVTDILADVHLSNDRRQRPRNRSTTAASAKAGEGLVEGLMLVNNKHNPETTRVKKRKYAGVRPAHSQAASQEPTSLAVARTTAEKSSPVTAKPAHLMQSIGRVRTSQPAKVFENRIATNLAEVPPSAAEGISCPSPRLAKGPNSCNLETRCPLSETDANKSILPLSPKEPAAANPSTKKKVQTSALPSSEGTESIVRGLVNKGQPPMGAPHLTDNFDETHSKGKAKLHGLTSDSVVLGEITACPSNLPLKDNKRKKMTRLSTHAKSKEESIDWLFAPHDEQDCVRRPQRNNKPDHFPTTRVKRTRDNDLAHVDLDDLVSNIGSIVGLGAGKAKGCKGKRL